MNFTDSVDSSYNTIKDTSTRDNQMPAKKINFYGGPFDGDVAVCDSIVGRDPIACQPEYGKFIHLYSVETRMFPRSGQPDYPKRVRGYHYLGCEVGEEIAVKKRRRRRKKKEGGDADQLTG